MTGRSELDELHALAASISHEAKGWRAHRRQRSQAAARRRAEAEMAAPIKRRKRHRLLAGLMVGVVAVTAAVLVITHKPAPPAPAPQRTSVVVRHLPAAVRAGRTAGIQLASQGRTPNIFACQNAYAAGGLGDVPAQQTATWRADYLAACADATGADAAGE